MQIMFSDNSRIKLEINNRKILGKVPNIWKLTNTLLNDIWAKEKVSREILKYFELNEYENTTYQNL